MGTSPAHTKIKKLGSYEVLREVAEGGMGVIYLARQPALERLVVLKKIRSELLVDPIMVERFQREARTAAAVHHQNVVAVHDCFSVRGDHYIALELVDGEDLKAVMKMIGRLDPEVAALIALEVIRGLEEIHARGVIHRDLKPSNILLGRGGEAKIADFGIALEGDTQGLTSPGTVVGSIPYLSPEQMLGERIEYRSDLFLFGLLLYEMLTGTTPFKESDDGSTDTLLERVQGGRYDSPRKLVPKVPRYLVRLIKVCLRAKPSRRIPSAHHVRRHLEWGLGNVSPADCRREIANYLWEREVFRDREDETRMQVVRSRSPGRFKYARRLIPATVAVLLSVVGFGGYAIGLFSGVGGDSPREPAQPVQTEMSSGPALANAGMKLPERVAGAPARVRFIAYPWAEIRIDGETSFLTPRANPIDLAPGRHRVVFEHPTFGREEVTVKLDPGQERIVRHVFKKAPKP